MLLSSKKICRPDQRYEQFLNLLDILLLFSRLFIWLSNKYLNLKIDAWKLTAQSLNEMHHPGYSLCNINAFFILEILETGTVVISKKIAQRKQGVSTNTPMTSALTGLVSLSVLVLIAYAIQKRYGGRDKPMLDIMEMGRREKLDKCNNL